MRFFDPHIHMTSRTTDDYQAMADAGVRAVIEPAFWLGQPRTTVGSFVDYFSTLVGWERFRASQFGISHYCAIGLNSKEANDEGLTREVLELLPLYALKEGVVAVGEIGYDEITDAEERAYQAQLEFALEHDMVVMVHSPHRDKKNGVLRSMDVAAEVGIPMGKLVIDHNNEETVQSVLDRGAWAAFTIYPHTKMGSQRMVELVKQYGPERMIVDSSADWGVSDPLAVPRTAALMLEQGVDPDWVEQTCWQNALEVYAQSGQIDVAALEQKPQVDQSQLFGDNSILRGQEPRVDAAVVN
ncbi:MAG: TatD family hydrolase [Planctomycetota bacterium]|nr:TatD family hydrolase [Planctomycetota bacterium]